MLQLLLQVRSVRSLLQICRVRPSPPPQQVRAMQDPSSVIPGLFFEKLVRCCVFFCKKFSRFPKSLRKLTLTDPRRALCGNS